MSRELREALDTEHWQADLTEAVSTSSIPYAARTPPSASAHRTQSYPRDVTRTLEAGSTADTSTQSASTRPSGTSARSGTASTSQKAAFWARSMRKR